jgi:hypothetical protein
MRITRYSNQSASYTDKQRRLEVYTDMYLTGGREIYRVWDWEEETAWVLAQAVSCFRS